MKSSGSPVRVLVYGSEAVGRSALLASSFPHVVTRFITRQSVISGMGRPSRLLKDLIPQDAPQRIAKEDVESSLAMWTRLDRDRTDLVVWDLTDERFGVEDLAEGVFRSTTPDYLFARDRLDTVEHRRAIPFGSEEHFELFQAAAARFVGLLNAVGLGDRCVVLAPEFAERLAGEGGTPAALAAAPELTDRFRRYWRFLSDACGLPVAVVPRSRTEADPHHPWGVAPLHFAGGALALLGEVIRNFAQTRAVERGRRASDRPLSRAGFVSQPPIKLRDLVSKPLTDDVYAVDVDGDLLHVLVNIAGRDDVPRVPVFFSGALSPGQVVRGPVFSGREMCRQLNLPLIAVADPSIGLLPHLDLGWYAGSQWSNAQAAVEKLLRAVSERLERDLLLVGGSGGGFAAIEQVTRTSSSHLSALVWNPQLDIATYGAPAVDRFLATAFPSYYLAAPRDARAAALEACCRDLGVCTELLSRAEHGAWRNILYLQQRSDWHYETYLRPLATALGFALPDVGAWASGGGVAGFVGTWSGDAQHVPPPRELLEDLISRACRSTAAMEALTGSINAEFGSVVPEGESTKGCEGAECSR